MSRLLVTNKSFELLEPYEGKLSRTVLRGESSRKGADLLDIDQYLNEAHSFGLQSVREMCIRDRGDAAPFYRNDLCKPTYPFTTVFALPL